MRTSGTSVVGPTSVVGRPMSRCPPRARLRPSINVFFVNEFLGGKLMNRSSSVPLGGLSPLGRLATAALAMLFSLALLALASGSAQAKLSAVGPVDAGTNFPTYYQDSNGLRLEP